MSDPDRAESSKKGRKRAKQERSAYYAALTMNPDRRVPIVDQQDDYQPPNIIARRTRRRTQQAVEENFDVAEEQEDHNRNAAGQSLEAPERISNDPTSDDCLSNAYSAPESSDPNYDESPPNTDSSPERRSIDPSNDENLPKTYSKENMLIPSRKGSFKKPRKKAHAECSSCGIGATESNHRIEVIFNDRGQPINEESVKMISLLGSLARERVDITFNDWRKVPTETKDKLWETVQKKFILEEQSKNFVMRELGYLWRTYKSRLNAMLDSYDNEADRIAAKPDWIDTEQWKIFTRQRASKEYQEKRKKFKEMRAKQTMPYTCSRKGYARLEAEMKKQSPNPSAVSRTDVWEKAHTRRNGEPANAEVAEKMKKIKELKFSTPKSPSSSFNDDALSVVLGPERRNRVRGVGFGVTPSKLGLPPQSNGKVVQLEQLVNELTKKISSMETLKQEMQEQMKAMQNLVNQLMQTQTQCGNCKPEGVKCKLFRMVKEDIVAEGCWVTDDPSTVVHGVPLGQGASKVWVDCAVESTARLWRPTNDMERMKDVVGSVIAWPTDNIITEDV